MRRPRKPADPELVESVKESLRLVCRKALFRLDSSEPDVRTIARQLEQIGKVVGMELDGK